MLGESGAGTVTREQPGSDAPEGDGSRPGDVAAKRTDAAGTLLIDVSFVRVFCESNYNNHSSDNTSLLARNETIKINKYKGKIDRVNKFVPAIHNEHGRAGPLADTLLSDLARSAPRHDYSTEDGGPTAATQIHNKLSRFRAIVSIHVARSMASAVIHGANAAPADPDG